MQRWPTRRTLNADMLRTAADGEFHGSEGCDDSERVLFRKLYARLNYETATQFLFPTPRPDSSGFARRYAIPADTRRNRAGRLRCGGRPDGAGNQTYLIGESGDTEWLRGLSANNGRLRLPGYLAWLDANAMASEGVLQIHTTEFYELNRCRVFTTWAQERQKKWQSVCECRPPKPRTV